MQAANTPISNRIQKQLTARLPLMWFSLAFLAGIVLASFLSLHTLVWIALVIISIILAILLRVLASRIHPLSFIFLFALFLGAARYQASVPQFDAFHIAFYNDRDYDLLITGTLVEPPDYRDQYTNL